MARERSSGSSKGSLIQRPFTGGSWLKTTVRSMNSTGRQYPLVPGTIFHRGHDWNTIRDTMPPIYLTRTGIHSRSSIKALGDDAQVAKSMIILVATPQYLARHGAPESPDDLNRFRGVVFVERGSVQPWSFGSGQDAKRVIPTGVFRTSDIEQMRMGVLEHLGIAQAPAWLFAAELREGTVIRLLTPFERTVPILAVRPASRRLSKKVRIFIEHLEKTFALCSQFNPRPS